MARRMNNKRRKKVYYNNSKDSWVDDGHEQYSLHPGQIADENLLKAEEELQKQEAKEEEEKKTDVALEEALAEQEKQKKLQKDVLWHKYNRYIRKSDQAKATLQIASDALGRDVSPRTLEDELRNDAVDMDSFKKDALKDYEHALAQKEAIPTHDTDHDGDIDHDDEPGPKTKAQRRMERYL